MDIRLGPPAIYMNGKKIAGTGPDTIDEQIVELPEGSTLELDNKKPEETEQLSVYDDTWVLTLPKDSGYTVDDVLKRALSFFDTYKLRPGKITQISPLKFQFDIAVGLVPDLISHMNLSGGLFSKKGLNRKQRRGLR